MYRDIAPKTLFLINSRPIAGLKARLGFCSVPYGTLYSIGLFCDSVQTSHDHSPAQRFICVRPSSLLAAARSETHVSECSHGLCTKALNLQTIDFMCMAAGTAAGSFRGSPWWCARLRCTTVVMDFAPHSPKRVPRKMCL